MYIVTINEQQTCRNCDFLLGALTLDVNV